MPGHPFATREAGLPLSEPAKVVPFHDLLPEEPFRYCVHLTQRSPSKRCGKKLNSRDRAAARALYEKILSSLVDGLHVQDLVLRLAKITLCNDVHRPAEGIEGLYIRLFNRWSGDLQKETAAHQRVMTEHVATRAARNEVDKRLRDPVVSMDHNGFSADAITSHDPDSANSRLVDEEEPRIEAIKSGPEYSLNKRLTLVSEVEIGQTDTESYPRVSPRTHCKPQGSAAPLPLPLIKRLTRSGTITQIGVDFLPCYPELLALNPSQLVHATNELLLPEISKPLTKTARLDGYIYIFTRPDDPKLVKIGYTKNPPERRVASWGRKCCYDAREEFVTKLTPHALLVERLAQVELAHCRKEEQKCKWKPLCKTKHREWFSISVQEARRVVERWAGWMQNHRPWGPDYTLRPEWRELLDKCRIALKQPSSDKDMWECFVRREHPRTLAPILRSPDPAKCLEQEQPTSHNIPIITPDRKSIISPTTLHGTTSKTPGIRRPPKLDTTFPTGPTIGSRTSPLSPVPSLSASTTSSSPTTLMPTPPPRRRTWHTAQTPPEIVRAALKSTFAYLDDHIGTGSSRGKNPTAPTRISIRLSQKSMGMSVAWGELDTGLCTA